MPRKLELPVVAGGRLITQPSIGLESVGAENFVRLLNVYRDVDKFSRMPGYSKFRPNTVASVTAQYTFDASGSPIQMAELIRGDGERVIIAASANLIKYFDVDTLAWVQIGSTLNQRPDTYTPPNLLTSPSDFSNPAWVNTNLLASTGSMSGPDGDTITAPILSASAGPAAERHVAQAVTIVAGTTTMVEVYFRPFLPSSRGRIIFGDATLGVVAAQLEFKTDIPRISNLSAFAGTPLAISGSLEVIGNGTWCRLRLLVKLDNSTTAAAVRLQHADASGGYVFAGSSTNAWYNASVSWFAQPARWQILTMAGYAIFNNGIDLPCWWQIGDAAVTPMHDLREAGIARAGWISTYNGFLFVGDLTEIKADQLPIWMNGYANYTQATNSAKAANFTILTAEHQNRFDVTTAASTITATLPTVTIGSYPLYFWIKKVDTGAGTVITSPVIVDEEVVLDAVGDIALVWWNGKRWAARVFPGGFIEPSDAYGLPPEAILEHIPDEHAWSELGQPINWAPLVSVVKGSASAVINLPFKPFNWTANTTRVGVINGGPDGGTLGGQSAYPNGVLITAFAAFSAAAMGVPMTIEVTTDAGSTYPREVSVTRWTDISTFVGKQRMGNGSRIICELELNGVLVTYQEDGIFITRWTAQAKAPFVLREKYSGVAVPMFGHCIVSVRNAEHIYPSVEGTFIRFDGLTDPVVHEACNDARDLFFAGLGSTDRCWAIDNPTLQSAWFCTPTKVMAYRYRKGSEGVSEIDAAIGCAVFARVPGTTSRTNWFVLGIGRFLYVFGFVNGVAVFWLRDGVATSAVLTSGLNSFRNQLNEKTLLSITPILSSTSPDVALTVSVKGTYNPSGTLTELIDPIEALPGPAGENFVACFVQAAYFQDSIVLTDTRDIDFRISARLFEFEVVGGLPVTRGNNG